MCGANSDNHGVGFEIKNGQLTVIFYDSRSTPCHHIFSPDMAPAVLRGAALPAPVQTWLASHNAEQDFLDLLSAVRAWVAEH